MSKSLKEIARSFKIEIETYRLVLNDSRTPKAAKFFLGGAIAYALSPIDLIPDFIPILGHVDDLLIVPLLLFIGLKFVPSEVVADCRGKATIARGGNECIQPVTPEMR